MGRRKKKKASTLPGDVSGEPDQNGEVSRNGEPPTGARALTAAVVAQVNLYGKAITDKMMVALAEELVKYENKERITLLDLSCNKITKLPDKLQRLHKLETLVLSCNKITALPHWIGDLAGLRELWLQDNPLEDKLPKQIEECHELRRLTVDAPLQKEAKQVLQLAKFHRDAEYEILHGHPPPPEKGAGAAGDDGGDDGTGEEGGGGVVKRVSAACSIQ